MKLEWPENVPDVVIELVGQEPPPNRTWCYVCTTLYMGAISSDETFREHVRKIVANANTKSKVYIQLPEHPFFALRPSITFSTSSHFPQQVGPVCWVHVQVHVQGYARPLHEKTSLIEGKA